MPKKILTIFIFGGTLVLSLAAVQVSRSQSTTPDRQIAYVVAGNLYTLDSNSRGNVERTQSGDVYRIFDQRSDGSVLFGRHLDPARNTDTTFSTQLWEWNTSGLHQLVSGGVMEALFIPGSSDTLYRTDDGDLFRIQRGQSTKLVGPVADIAISADGVNVSYIKLNADWKRGEYGDHATGLATINLATLQEKQLTTNWEDFGSSWAPDGKTIAFSSGRTGIASIWFMDTDGQHQRQITNVGQIDYNPETTLTAPNHPPLWSPTGTDLVYESDRKVWHLQVDRERKKVIESKNITFGEQPVFLNATTVAVLALPQNTLGSKVIKVNLRGDLVN